MTAAETGRKGEAAAAKYYLAQGYALLEHNYRTRRGELDLVLRRADVLVVCEVKTRSIKRIAAPAEAVDRQKQRRLVLAASEYLQEHPDLALLPVRFDVAEVTPVGGSWQIHCIPNAFETTADDGC